MEAGIPEDDPRNPGVIADNVGDNVGDVAGMGSDIFESYCGAMIASIAIASTLAMSEITSLTALDFSTGQAALMSLPLALASLGLICSIIGILTVRALSAKAPEFALRMGHQLSALVLIGGAYQLCATLGISSNVWWALVVGTAGGVLIGLVTDCLLYTSPSPRDQRGSRMPSSA